VLVIGNGGREHAIAWKLAQSSRIDKIYIAPGNGGTRQIGQNIAIDPSDIQSLVDFASNESIDLTVVGPDEPLALGIVDLFQARGLRIFGPTCRAAQIEASKVFAKRLMEKVGIPTARFGVFDDYDSAVAHLVSQEPPLVIKADGLAAGKGVSVCQSLAQGEIALSEIFLQGRFGEAGSSVVVEEFLEGEEVSIHVLTDGQTSILWPPAQDHKPVKEGNLGENTGGMGTVVPVPWVDQGTLEEIDQQIVRPALQALSDQGQEFAGLLYPGLKMTTTGPNVMEFNARFGDPEMQSYVRLLKTDLLDVLEACVDRNLSEVSIEWEPGFAVCVVLVSKGYPGRYKTGFPISGIDLAEAVEGVVVFQAGTEMGDQLRTSGGRVLGVTAVGSTLLTALTRAYLAIHLIEFKGKSYRRDIGLKALQSAP